MMGHFVGLPSRRLFRLWLLCWCVALLGLALVSLAQPQVAGAAASPVSIAATGTHTPAATQHPGTANTGNHASSESKVSPAPSWLVEGLVVLFLLLLGFSLIAFPIAVRSLRIERRSRPAFSPAPVEEEEQVARLSQIAPERKEPLTREQLQALHAVACSSVDVSQHATAHLAAVRIVDGVPVSMPITEAETVPRLPAPPQPAPRVIESRAQETTGNRQR